MLVSTLHIQVEDKLLFAILIQHQFDVCKVLVTSLCLSARAEALGRRHHTVLAEAKVETRWIG